jgi:hypothetical protein
MRERHVVVLARRMRVSVVTCVIMVVMVMVIVVVRGHGIVSRVQAGRSQ